MDVAEEESVSQSKDIITGQTRPPHRKRLQVNLRAAKRILGKALDARLRDALDALSEAQFSIRSGDLQLIDGNWYVSHTGLLRLARRKRCRGIHVEAVDSLCDSAASRFVLKATVYPSKDSAGFVGYGDADPSNVSLRVRGAEMRMAETRAVNRALRKAYGIGICSVEEIGSIPGPIGPARRVRRRSRRMESQTEMAPVPVTRYATGSAKSFASTSSIPSWSRPMPSISVAPKH